MRKVLLFLGVLLLTLDLVVGSASAVLTVVSDSGKTFIDWQSAGVSIFKIDDTDGVSSASKATMTITTAATDPGRQVYWQFTSTAVASGKQLQGLQIKASWGGTANSTEGGITGAEIKARASSDSITHTLGQARAIVANVDCKKATFSKGYCFEAAVDVGAGGTITEAIGFRAFLNNSGTVTDGYAFYVDAVTNYPWEYGFYVESGMATHAWYSSTTSTASGSVFYLTHTSSAASGNVYGIRLFISSTDTSGNAGMIRGIRCEADMGAGAKATLLEAGLFTAKVSSGTATVTNVRALSGHVSIGDTLIVSGDVVCLNAHMQTRGNEDITGAHSTLYLKNEAVGGNGKQMTAWITLVATSLSGVSGANYVIDGGTATDVTGTAILRFGDDGTICNETAESPLSDIQNTASTGFIKVIIGTQTRYIALYSAN